MNVKIFFYISLILFGLTGGYWVVQHPYFRIAHIDIRPADDSGSLKRAKVVQIFEAVRPDLTGSFFTIDLQQAKKTAQAQPWVREAALDRIAPNRVQIYVWEFDAAARWVRSGEQAGLVAADGKVFQAAYAARLPELDGEYSDLPVMLEQYRRFESRLKPLRLGIKRLQYTPRGAWTLMLNNGMEVRLGKDNIHARLLRFTELWLRVFAAQAGEIDYVDMRYPDGAAMKRRADAPPLLSENEVR